MHTIPQNQSHTEPSRPLRVLEEEWEAFCRSPEGRRLVSEHEALVKSFRALKTSSTASRKLPRSLFRRAVVITAAAKGVLETPLMRARRQHFGKAHVLALGPGRVSVRTNSQASGLVLVRRP